MVPGVGVKKSFLFHKQLEAPPTHTHVHEKDENLIYKREDGEKWCLVAKPTNLRQVHLEEHEHCIKSWRIFFDIVQVAVQFSAEIPCRLEKIQAVGNFLKFTGEKCPIRRFRDTYTRPD